MKFTSKVFLPDYPKFGHFLTRFDDIFIIVIIGGKSVHSLSTRLPELPDYPESTVCIRVYAGRSAADRTVPAGPIISAALKCARVELMKRHAVTSARISWELTMMMMMIPPLNHKHQNFPLLTNPLTCKSLNGHFLCLTDNH